MTLLPPSGLRIGAQSVTVQVAGDAVVVRAPGFNFIKGETLKRLRDGRSVRVDLRLEVLLKPGVTTSIQGRQAFILSYDLWEERFAVTVATVPPRTISHVTQTGAEAWCVEQMAMPVSTLGRLGHDLPFWIRLEYRVLDDETGTPGEDDGSFTLRGLIDALSRRRKADEATGAIEAGPMWLKPSPSPVNDP